jgi:hypothetical protein
MMISPVHDFTPNGDSDTPAGRDAEGRSLALVLGLCGPDLRLGYSIMQ